jgi:hypothetical protein
VSADLKVVLRGAVQGELRAAVLGCELHDASSAQALCLTWLGQPKDMASSVTTAWHAVV